MSDSDWFLVDVKGDKPDTLIPATHQQIFQDFSRAFSEKCNSNSGFRLNYQRHKLGHTDKIYSMSVHDLSLFAHPVTREMCNIDQETFQTWVTDKSIQFKNTKTYNDLEEVCNIAFIYKASENRFCDTLFPATFHSDLVRKMPGSLYFRTRWIRRLGVIVGTCFMLWYVSTVHFKLK